MRHFIGVDPGKSSGSIAIVDGAGEVVSTIALKRGSETIWNWLCEHREPIAFGVLEQVHAMPGQGVSSTFKFGASFGFCGALLTCARIPYELHRPAKWQGYMDCRTRGDKNITKVRAQGLFPETKVTHAIADALLIADYARRLTHERE